MFYLKSVHISWPDNKIHGSAAKTQLNCSSGCFCPRHHYWDNLTNVSGRIPLKNRFWTSCLDTSPSGGARAFCRRLFWSEPRIFCEAYFAKVCLNVYWNAFLFFCFHAAPFFPFESFLTLSGESLRFRKEKKVQKYFPALSLLSALCAGIFIRLILQDFLFLCSQGELASFFGRPTSSSLCRFFVCLKKCGWLEHFVGKITSRHQNTANLFSAEN